MLVVVLFTLERWWHICCFPTGQNWFHTEACISPEQKAIRHHISSIFYWNTESVGSPCKMPTWSVLEHGKVKKIIKSFMFSRDACWAFLAGSGKE